MKPLRVTLVEFNPAGGLFQFAFQLGQALAERGHRVELLTGPDPELASAHPGFEVLGILPTWHPDAAPEGRLTRKVRRGWRAVRYVWAWTVVCRRLRRDRPDVVQWASWRFALDGAFAWVVARRGWAGASVDLCHSPRPLEEQRSSGDLHRSGPLLDRGLSAGYRAMDSVMVLGESSRRELTDSWQGIRRVDVIPHGDEEVLRGGVAPPAPSECGPSALLFGTLTAYKGVDLLLDAWPQIRGLVPDARLRIVGAASGDLDIEPLMARAAALPGVEMDVGYVPLSEVATVVGAARVMVAPYRRSNASGVVRLAQSMGRPVVVCDVGDLTDSVDHGVSGLVVPPADRAALADAVAALLRDGEAADRLGHAGRQQLERTASWTHVAARVEAVYAAVLAGRRR